MYEDFIAAKKELFDVEKRITDIEKREASLEKERVELLDKMHGCEFVPQQVLRE